MAKEEAKAITAQMATIAEAALGEAKKVAANAQRGLRPGGDVASGRAHAKLAELELLIYDDSSGSWPRPGDAYKARCPKGRLVSLHDPDARPIKKGPHRQACRVRLPCLGARQRGRGRPRPQRACRQPARRPAALPGRRASEGACRPSAASGDRRPALRRSQS